jgi:hypothetical protein
MVNIEAANGYNAMFGATTISLAGSPTRGAGLPYRRGRSAHLGDIK